MGTVSEKAVLKRRAVLSQTERFQKKSSLSQSFMYMKKEKKKGQFLKKWS